MRELKCYTVDVRAPGEYGWKSWEEPGEVYSEVLLRNKIKFPLHEIKVSGGTRSWNEFLAEGDRHGWE